MQQMKCSKWNAAHAQMQHMHNYLHGIRNAKSAVNRHTHLVLLPPDYDIWVVVVWVGYFFFFFFSAFEQLFAVFAFLSSFISLQVFHFPFLAYFNALVVVVFFLCNQCPCHTCTGTRASTARSCSTPRQSASARRWTAKPSACGTTCVMLFIFVVTAKS